MKSEKKKYLESQKKMASYCKAIAHPARIAILEFLIQKQNCFCGDIVDQLPLSQSTVSQHLKELKKAGLIKGDIEGTKVCYCINQTSWQEAKILLNQFFTKETISTDCC